MTKEELLAVSVDALDRKAFRGASIHWDGIAKPLDGLGKLEELVKKIAGITGTADVDIGEKAIIIMCADNGIIEEGVSQSEHEVTSIVAANMAKGLASICRMAGIAGADVIPVDIGMKDTIVQKNLMDAKVAPGTRNFLKEPAMTEKELMKAIGIGINMVAEWKEKGYQILATGEMGIGNTTTSSALASVLLDIPVESVTGKGAGLSREGIEHKKRVISQAIKKHGLKKEQTWRTLMTVGGLDIAGLTGVYIGGAIYHVPVIIDGVISAVAALAAERLIPGCREYMLPSHMGKEPAAAAIMAELGLEPIIDAGLALGEGTGAVLLFPMLDMALEVYRENTTFEDVNIGQYERFECR